MILVTAFIIGFLFSKALDTLKKRYRERKIAKHTSVQFKEILSNLKKNRTVFISRVNQTVMIDTKLKDYSTVSLVYLMDKKIVCIFKEEKCVYSSDTIDKELGDAIIKKIHEKYGKEINDVIEVLGVTISREELQSKMKDFERFYPNIDLNTEKKESSDIEKIIVENEKRFELDSILDKISIVGVEKLTKEELDFLKEQSKKQ
jgi:hypothetical protein